MADTYTGPLVGDGVNPTQVPVAQGFRDSEVYSSGVKAIDAVISDQPAHAVGVDVHDSGSGNVQLTLYDNASAASGTAIFKSPVLAADASLNFNLDNVRCENGIYADIAGTAPEYIVRYRR